MNGNYTKKVKKCKQSLYLPERYVDEIVGEALRQGRSMSWLVQQAWTIARERVLQFPSDPAYIERKERIARLASGH